MAQGLGGTRDVEAEREGKQASTAKKGVLEERKEEVEEWEESGEGREEREKKENKREDQGSETPLPSLVTRLRSMPWMILDSMEEDKNLGDLRMR